MHTYLCVRWVGGWAYIRVFEVFEVSKVHENISTPIFVEPVKPIAHGYIQKIAVLWNGCMQYIIGLSTRLLPGKESCMMRV